MTKVVTIIVTGTNVPDVSGTALHVVASGTDLANWVNVNYPGGVDSIQTVYNDVTVVTNETTFQKDGFGVLVPVP